MCGGGFTGIRDALETAAVIAGNYELPGSSLLTNNLASKGAQQNLNSPLGQIANIGSGAAGGGAFGSGLQSAGGAFESSALNSLLDSVGSATGLTGIGDDIGSGLSRFADSSGLSQLFGGTAAPTSDFSNAFNSINAAAPSAEAAAGATNAANFAPGGSSSSYLPTGSVGSGAAGGGQLGGLISPEAGSAGSGVLGSSSGAGGILSDPFSAATSGGGTANDLFNSAFSNPGASGAVGSGVSGFSIPGVAATGEAALSGGSAVAPSGLSSLFGGNSGAVNGLLRGGLGALLTDNNNKGYNAQISAGQGIQDLYNPYQQTGTAANDQLAALYGLNGNGAQAAAQANWQNTPGYQFQLDQGLKAVNANAARMGQTLSGNNQQAVNNYAQGTANQTYNSYLQNLIQQQQSGMNAAGGVATGMAGVANAQSGKSGAAVNTQNAGLSTALSSLFPSNNPLLQLFGGNGSSNRNGLLSMFG